MSQATDDEFDRVLRDHWPDATHVSDPEGELYARHGVGRGGVREMFGWRAWRAGVPAFLAGHRIGSPGDADAWTLPTVVRLRDGEVVAEHRGDHAGDHPGPDAMTALISDARDGGRDAESGRR